MASDRAQGDAGAREPAGFPPGRPPAERIAAELSPCRRVPLPLFVITSVTAVVMGFLWTTTRSDLDDARNRLSAIDEAEAALPDLEEIGRRHLQQTGVIEDAGPDHLSANFSGLLGLDELEELLAELDFRAAVINRIGNTRALDGTQTADAPHVVATWTYHPDSGLDIVFERQDP